MAVPSLASPDQFVTIIYAPNAEQATFNITSSSTSQALPARAPWKTAA
jgi:hypothetical protein